MADVKISQLPAAASIASTDVAPVVTGGVTSKVTAQAIVNGGLSGGTANGVAYLNGSKAVSTSSNFTYDGTSLFVESGATNAKLNAYSAGKKYLDFTWYNTSIGYIGQDSGTYITINSSTVLPFLISGSEQMRLTTTGLGIGTTSPANKLDTVGDGRFFRPTGYGGSANTYIEIGGTDNGFVNNGAASSWRQYVAGDAYGQSLRFDAFLRGEGWTTRATLDSSGNFGLGVTPSAWSSSWKAFQFGSVGAAFSNSGNAILSGNEYLNSGGVPTYLTSQYALRYRQDVGSGYHAWFTAPSGTAGDAISFTQALTLHASGGLSLGNTTDPGASNLSVTGSTKTANANTGSGTVASTASGTAYTVFSASSSGMYQVIAYLLNDVAIYIATAVVASSGGAAKITATNGSNMTLTLSGTNVQATQTSGATQTIYYSYLKIV